MQIKRLLASLFTCAALAAADPVTAGRIIRIDVGDATARHEIAAGERVTLYFSKRSYDYNRALYCPECAAIPESVNVSAIGDASLIGVPLRFAFLSYAGEPVLSFDVTTYGGPAQSVANTPGITDTVGAYIPTHGVGIGLTGPQAAALFTGTHFRMDVTNLSASPVRFIWMYPLLLTGGGSLTLGGVPGPSHCASYSGPSGCSTE